MLLFARMARLSHRLGGRSRNSAVAQYQKVIDKHFSKSGDLAWTTMTRDSNDRKVRNLERHEVVIVGNRYADYRRRHTTSKAPISMESEDVADRTVNWCHDTWCLAGFHDPTAESANFSSVATL